MSNVPKSERRESKVEFDNTFFKIYSDCILIIDNDFSPCNDTLKNKYSDYIQTMKAKVLETVCDIGKNIRIANSIYPIKERKRFYINRDWL